MARSIVVAPKKRGRPSKGGRYPLVAARFPPPLIETIDGWAAKAGDGVSRSEAIRRLVELGLKAKGTKR
jgi:hypothetical protein